MQYTVNQQTPVERKPCQPLHLSIKIKYKVLRSNMQSINCPPQVGRCIVRCRPGEAGAWEPSEGTLAEESGKVGGYL